MIVFDTLFTFKSSFWALIKHGQSFKDFMGRFAIDVGTVNDDAYVAFNAPSATYTDEVLAEINVIDATNATPTGVQVYGPLGAYARVVFLKAKLANGNTASFVCDAQSVSTAMVSLRGKVCRGSTIVSVRQPRSRYRI